MIVRICGGLFFFHLPAEVLYPVVFQLVGTTVKLVAKRSLFVRLNRP